MLTTGFLLGLGLIGAYLVFSLLAGIFLVICSFISDCF